MSGSDAFGERQPRGLLARLFGPKSPTIRRTVTKTELLNVEVPTERVEAMQAARDAWLHGHGIAAASTVEPKDDRKSRIHVKLGPADTAKLDLSSDRVQSELQDLLGRALSDR